MPHVIILNKQELATKLSFTEFNPIPYQSKRKANLKLKSLSRIKPQLKTLSLKEFCSSDKRRMPEPHISKLAYPNHYRPRVQQ
jgi:hypothetical protein